MTEERAVYTTGEATEVFHLPRRAVNLARRILQVEKDCEGRGHVEVKIVFLNGEWVMWLAKPGELERLGE